MLFIRPRSRDCADCCPNAENMLIVWLSQIGICAANILLIARKGKLHQFYGSVCKRIFYIKVNTIIVDLLKLVRIVIV